MYEFDVFISYNSKDKSRAKNFGNELKRLGLNVWLDIWSLPFGVPFMQGLYEGINNSKSIVALIGPSGMGPWEKKEVEDALIKAVSRSMRIIPVILDELDSEPDIPPFLDHYRVIDLRKREIFHKGLDEVIWGITGRKPLTILSQFGEEFDFEFEII